MPSEMLSGPDLGAGFLHQLTTDRDGDRTTFTYHAQDGGADANGPPKGPLDVFGFVHPPAPCPFGGPRCWHRRFLLPFDATPRVRPCYNRSRFVLQAMMDQVYDAAPVAIEPALTEVVEHLARPGPTTPDRWCVGGSAGAWMLGAPLAPRGIRLGVARSVVDAVGAALSEFLIEPPSTTDWPGVGIVQGARAFVGTFVSGARVDWAVPLEPSAPSYPWVVGAHGPRRVTVTFHGRPVSVARPEYTFVRAAVGRTSRDLRGFADWLRGYGVDRELLEELLSQQQLPAPEVAFVRAALAP
jgi:hypothetical protein